MQFHGEGCAAGGGGTEKEKERGGGILRAKRVCISGGESKRHLGIRTGSKPREIHHRKSPIRTTAGLFGVSENDGK